MNGITHPKPEKVSSSTRGLSGLLYLVAGAGVGAAAGLLLAPKSGSELRGDIAEVTQRGYDKTAGLAARVRDQSRGLIETAKEKTSRKLDLTSANGSKRSQAKDNSQAEVSPELAEGVRRLEEKFAPIDANAPQAAPKSFDGN